jgi:hypothetical protein
MRASRVVLWSAVLVVISVVAAGAQSYNPVGPQTNVPIATVTGGDWVECYSEPYNAATGNDLDAIQANCTGSRIMLACAPAGADTLTLLSQASASEVFTDPGTGSSDSHVANGAQWYFNDADTSDGGEGSWGFAATGDSLNRSNCDVASGASPEARLCWHLNGDNGGYRCGTAEGLNSTDEWIKYVYTTAPGVPTAAPWQLAVIALLLSLAAGAVLRRRLTYPTTLERRRQP